MPYWSPPTDCRCRISIHRSDFLTSVGGTTTAWLYLIWHAGFPLLVPAFVLLGRRPGGRVTGSAGRVVGLAITSVAQPADGASSLAHGGMVTWTFDVTCMMMLGFNRSDMGFYEGRLYGFVSTVVVPGALLSEMNRSYDLASKLRLVIGG